MSVVGSESPEEMYHKKVTCVFVHGWAMNQAVWSPVIELLPDWIDAVLVDLPGHGGMREQEAAGLDEYVRIISSVTGHRAVWVGWSLGGMVTQSVASAYPHKVAGLYQIASTPCFVQKTGWKAAIEAGVFDQFAAFLSEDMEQTIKRFLALQVMGAEDARSTLQSLQLSIRSRGLPTRAALEGGLDILKQDDLRENMTTLDRPTRWLLGGRDTLVPVAVESALKELNPVISTRVISDAGHAPFVSHPGVVADDLARFAASFRDG